MIPLRDHQQVSVFPFVTWGLILTNVVVFFYMFSLSPRGLEQFVETYSVIPYEISRGQDLITIVTAMFLHGGLFHILGNMLFLHVFGDNLEERLGHLPFLLFYLLSGIGATLLQVFVNPTSTIPNLGASGAIAGLMGGYLVLFPSHQVDILVPVFAFVQTATVPAFVILFYWIVYQFILGLGTFGLDGGGVAYFAHIGGFITGLLLIKVFDRKPYSSSRA